MADVRAWVGELVQALATAELSDAATAPPTDKPTLGACPACQQPVRDRGPVYACDTGRACPFVVFKKMSKRAISARTVKQLLQRGRSEAVKGFKSKRGKDFTAGLVWDGEQRRVGFWFPERASDATPPRERSIRVGAPCPSCGQGSVMQGRVKLGCSRWRDGCSWTHAP